MTRLVLGICLLLLLVPQGGYAMQPPPPPLDIAQLKMLVAQADIIVVGKINKVNETEGTIEATLDIEKLLKGKAGGKTILIKETYITQQSPVPSPGPGSSQKMIVRTTAGPATYHGKYIQGGRIVVLLQKIEATDKYRPLGSGTYDKHLCEFLIEDKDIKTLYFQCSDYVRKYLTSEKQFIAFIKKLIKAGSNKGGI
jgi:hypothetical protein